ncbi:MAG: ABC transporter ATP-binding protein [Acidimicrobiia bacterium]
MVTEHALVLAGLHRWFDDHHVLNGLELEVPRGELHAILGPNGAGKTTLLRIISGITEPSSGLVTVDGVTTRPGSDRNLRREIGLIAASANSFYMRLSGLENLLFFGRLQGMAKRHAVERSRELLERVGLTEAMDRRVGHYSTGMQRRLTVARALLTEPVLLLADETTAGLDPAGARSVRALFTSIAGAGTTVLWTTQRIDEIRGFADRVSFLHDGRFLFTGTVPEMVALARPKRYIVELQSDEALDSVASHGGAVLEGVAELESVGVASSRVFALTLEPEEMIGSALVRLSGAGIQVVSCTEERSPIDEAFTRLSGGVA